MSKVISQRLASHTTSRQIEASLLADQAAATVDRAIATALRRLVKANPRQADWHSRTIVATAVVALRNVLVRIARWGHRETRRNLSRTLPTTYLRAMARKRVGLLEAFGAENRTRPKREPGDLELVLHALGMPVQPFDASELLFGVPSREPAKEPLSVAEQRAAFLDMLFPPPPAEQVERIVRASGWEQRLATKTSATPSQIATIVSQGAAQGKTQREVAKELLPVVDGVRSTARRIARTEGIRIANETQFEAWQGMGEMIYAYQIHAVLDQVTRPAHALRNGTIYYVNPGPGQKGLDEMPMPPQESERDGKITAHN